MGGPEMKEKAKGMERDVRSNFNFAREPESMQRSAPNIFIDLTSLSADLDRIREDYNRGNYEDAKSRLLRLNRRIELMSVKDGSLEQIQLSILKAAVLTVLGMINIDLDLREAQTNFLQAVQLFDQWLFKDTEQKARNYKDYGIALTMTDCQKAAEYLQKAMDLGDTTPEVYVYLGMIFKDLRQYDKAEENLKKALEIISVSNIFQKIQAQKALAETLKDLNRYDESASAYTKAFDLLISCNKLDDALEVVENILEFSPDNPEALAYKGDLLRLDGQYNEALQFLEKALLFDRDNPRYLAIKGAALNGLGKREEALEILDRAIDLEPDHAWLLGTKGLVLNAMSRYDEAIEALKRSIEIDSSMAWTYGELGNALRYEGRNDEALQALDNALDLAPDDTWSLGHEGLSLVL
jgi:tetratricopeptide (TPR) repeat protein